MSKKLKIVWSSNAAYVPSGYGVQTALFAKAFQQAGHEVAIRCFYGHRGAIMEAEGVRMLPGTYTETGEDVLAYDWKREKADALILLYDIWAYNPNALRAIPLTAYAPIDHQPAPPAVIDRLKYCRHIWAMSRFGEREMRQAGLDPFYVPHMVNTDVYKPIDRAQARDKWGVPQDKFFVVVNAANKGFPSRKNLPQLIKAWSLFIQSHPDAMLYLHTNPYPNHMGYDLLKTLEFYGIPDTNVRFADPDKLRDGEFTDGMLNHLYNAADVLLSPSAGEGFGVPVLEAAAAGCPVIVTDFTAQSELCWSGWKIPVDRVDDLWLTNQGAEWAWVRPSAIITALEQAYDARGDTGLRARAREGAMDYDVSVVASKYALPSLVTMAQINADIRPQLEAQGVAA